MMAEPLPLKTTINVLGMDLPVIADLGDGYVLALHQNGPCVVGQGAISALVGVVHPAAIYDAAVAAYVAWSWPVVYGGGE